MSFNRSLLTQITKDLADKKKPAKPKAGAQQKIGDSNPYYIDKSDIAGKGAFAKQFIPKGSSIDLLHQINQPGVDYDFTQLGKSYNHSDDPNTINRLQGNQRFMVANQDIYPGQELTGDYRMQPDLEQPQDNWKMKNGGQMIKRADGSYSKRGLWDNIRANKGSGKKPTKQMLEQERRIKAKMQGGGEIDIDGQALQGLGKVFSTISDVMSIPARGVVKALTGKYQDPSQALGVTNPVAAWLTNSVLDPTNLVGAGVAAKVLGTAGKASKASKIVKGVDQAVGAVKGADKVAGAGQAYKIAPPRNIPIEASKYRAAAHDAIGALTERGMILDQQGAFKKPLTPNDIDYFGTLSGRPVVGVNTPNGPEYFYKSTAWAPKSHGTVEGEWQAFGQYMDAPEGSFEGVKGTTTDWFVKGDRYKQWYDSQTFKNIAKQMDNVIMQKYGLPEKDLDKFLNFQNRQGPVDTFTPPRKAEGGESDNVRKFMEVYHMKYGGGTPMYKEGGQTRDEREMVNGIADILSKVKDRGNRGEIAQEMIQDFEDEGVTYNVKKFMDAAQLKYGGTPYTHLQEGGEAQPEPEYTGSSIVDYLATKGFEGSKTFRKELAKDMNIEGYDFSAKKNLELLNALRKADSLPIGYEESFDPVSPQEMIALEQKRGVYVPMPDAAPEPQQVVSHPVSNKFRIPMAAAPAPSGEFDPRYKNIPAGKPGVSNAFRIPMAAPGNPYGGFFDPRIPQNTVPASKAAAAAPVKSAQSNAFRIPQGPGKYPGMFDQQAALNQIKNAPAVSAKRPVTGKTKEYVQENPKEYTREDNATSNPFAIPSMGPIMGSTINTASLETAADDIAGLWEKAVNYFDRKTAMGDGKEERKSTIDPKKIASDPIYMTGDTIPDKKGRYHIPEVMDLNYMRFGTRNRGDYTPIDTEAGSITAFKPFVPAKDYFAKNNDPANSTYMGVGTDGKMKVGSRADFQDGDYKISKTFSNKVVDFNRNPDGSIVKVKSNPKASKETFSPSVKVMGDDGKVVDGKLSLLLPKSGNQEESFDLVTGGRYILQTPDGKFEMVSGSLKNIEERFNKLKKGNPYVNVITLDNGSYSRGIRTYNKKLSAKDLKSYDNQNTEGGNFAYLMPGNPATRYDAKFNDFQSAAQNRLQSLYPGKKVEVKFQNEGVYDERGSRAIESQADILKKGNSKAPISMHNFDAARDYVLYVDGKPIDANKQKKVYKDVLWKAADQTGMYHLDDWDVVHIGLAKEGEKTGFNELYSKYPDIFASGNFKKSVAFIEKNKNNPAYKEAYELLHNIKPYVPKTQSKQVVKKQYGGSWLDKYN